MKLVKTLIAMSVIVVALSLVACSSSKKTEPTTKPAAAGKTIAVTLHDDPTGMWTDPKEVDVKAGENVTFDVTNDGTVVHNLKKDDKDGTSDLKPFANAKFDFGKVTEDTVVYCTIPGHREQGMELKIKVTK